MKKKIINLLLKVYIIYSIACDIVIISGIGYLIFK